MGYQGHSEKPDLYEQITPWNYQEGNPFIFFRSFEHLLLCLFLFFVCQLRLIDLYGLFQGPWRRTFNFPIFQQFVYLLFLTFIKPMLS
jgi:hypothetical protein